uniref:hypothetical protein n=1 Tax=Cyanothece sp. BG0011 TaxID=2082950 RepID=UPI001E486001|nr:hypothetical protein [Cyanothece sp. BG0011]
MYKVKISDEAELDLEEAYQWYETQVNQLGSEFIRKVDDSLSSIKILVLILLFIRMLDESYYLDFLMGYFILLKMI